MSDFSKELLERYADRLDEQGKEYLRFISEAIQAMGYLIDDLLRLSRVTRSDMHWERVDFSTLVVRRGPVHPA